MFRIAAKSAKRAEILIYGDVGLDFWGEGVSANAFKNMLDEIGAVDDLDVRINSYGGDVFEGFAIYRHLVENKARVHVMIDGIAASIASVIAMAGDSISIAEPGRMMIHDALTIALGNAEDFRKAADVLDETSDQIAGVYASRTGKSKTELRDKMRAETWLSAEDALALGLVTDIAKNKTPEGAQQNRLKAQTAEIIQLDLEKHKFRNTPPDLMPGRSAIANLVARQQVALTLSGAVAKR